MSRYLLDTTFLIDYMRDDPATVTRYAQFFEDGDDVLVNEIVVCEARSGVPDESAAAFDAMLRPLEFVQAGPQWAILAGQWRVRSRQKGFVLSLADALIGAAADAAGATVLTRNLRDFQLMPVRVETY
jgi:predicted nucleic acid-binding protein